MASRREDILARLFTVLGGLSGSGYQAIERNVLQVSDGPDGQLPRRLVLLDGGEREDAERRTIVGRRVSATLGQIMVMTPEVHVYWGAPAASVGTELNARLAELQSAVMHDATLNGLLLDGEPIVYRTLQSGYQSQLAIPGFVIAAFDLAYRLTVPAP